MGRDVRVLSGSWTVMLKTNEQFSIVLRFHDNGWQYMEYMDFLQEGNEVLE
jgi:hypothetical protein